MSFRNSYVFRCLFYVCAPMLLFVFGILMYRFVMAIPDFYISDLTMVFVGLLALYLFGSCMRFRKYVNATILIDDDGFTVRNGKIEHFFPWEGKTYTFRESATWQLTEVFDENNRRILMVDHLMPGYDMFQGFMREHIPDESRLKTTTAI